MAANGHATCDTWSLLHGLIFLVIFSNASAAEFREFCLQDKFKVDCQENEVILIEEARYGRMRSGRCISKGYGNLGCSSDVTAYLDGMCSGRQSCELKVRSLMDVAQPCTKDLTNYLEAKFSCVAVATGSPELCHRSSGDNLILISGQTEGYIASYMTQEIGYGAAGCPWAIEVSSGQRINFTLLDFNTRTHSGEEEEEDFVGGGCPMGLVIEENRDRIKQEDICMNGPKQKSIHITKGNKALVHFVMHTNYNRRYHFLLKYQAIGCSDIKIPKGGWAKRDSTGDNLQVTCNSTGEIWYLTCRDGEWIGDVGTCDEGGLNATNSSSGFPFGLMLAVVIGIVLGVIVGVTLLGIVFLCRKGYKNKSLNQQARSSIDNADLYSESTQFRGVGYPKLSKPTTDPRPISAGDYGYKHDCTTLNVRNNTMDNRAEPEALRKSHDTQANSRVGTGQPTRSHVYESPKFTTRGQGLPGDPPPVYHELDPESDGGSGRYTN